MSSWLTRTAFPLETCTAWFTYLVLLSYFYYVLFFPLETCTALFTLLVLLYYFYLVLLFPPKNLYCLVYIFCTALIFSICTAFPSWTCTFLFTYLILLWYFILYCFSHLNLYSNLLKKNERVIFRRFFFNRLSEWCKWYGVGKIMKFRNFFVF